MTPDQAAGSVEGFRQGLREHGYIEGSNIAIEYRFAEHKFDRLPASPRSSSGSVSTSW